MGKFQLKSGVVEAIQFNMQPMNKLPQWVQEYSKFAASGQNTAYISPVKTLMIPDVATGGFNQAAPGDWLVFDGDTISVMREASFLSKYEEAPTLVEEAPAPAPVPVKELKPIEGLTVTEEPVTEAASPVTEAQVESKSE